MKSVDLRITRSGIHHKMNKHVLCMPAKNILVLNGFEDQFDHITDIIEEFAYWNWRRDQ